MKKQPATRSGVLSLSVFLMLCMGLVIGCKKGGGSSSGGAAMGSLQDDKGLCLPGTVNGSWHTEVVAGTDTNYVEIGVNVTRAGSYKISSDQQNGVSFSDSGIFTGTGMQMVRLHAQGVFENPVTTNFSISFDSSTCGFSIVVDTMFLPDNSWRFTARGRTYFGAGTSQWYDLPNDYGAIIDLYGNMYNGGDTALFIELALGVDNYYPYVGTFRTDRGATFSFNRNGTAIFLGSSLVPDKVITINVTGFDVSRDKANRTREMLGTFSGTAVDSAGKDVIVTYGRFRIFS